MNLNISLVVGFLQLLMLVCVNNLSSVVLNSLTVGLSSSCAAIDLPPVFCVVDSL